MESVIDSVKPLSDPRGLCHPCSTGDEGVGSADLSREIGSMGQAPHEGAPMGSTCSVVFRSPVRHSGNPQHGVQSRLVVVAGRLSFAGGISSPPPSLLGAPVYRQLTGGLGAHIDPQEASGIWSQEESWLHINVLEMRLYFSIFCQFCLDKTGVFYPFHRDFLLIVAAKN